MLHSLHFPDRQISIKKKYNTPILFVKQMCDIARRKPQSVHEKVYIFKEFSGGKRIRKCKCLSKYHNTRETRDNYIIVQRLSTCGKIIYIYKRGRVIREENNLIEVNHNR